MLPLSILLLTSLCVAFTYRSRVTHPCFIVPPFIALYGGWYGLSKLVLSGSLSTNEIYSIWLACFALGSFFISALVFEAASGKQNSNVNVIRPLPLEKPISVFIILIVTLLAAYVIVSGQSSKRSAVDALYVTNDLIPVFFLLFHFVIVRVVCLFFNSALNGRYVLLVFASASVVMLTIGERNFLFTALLVSLLMFLKGKSKVMAFPYLVSLLVLMLFFLPITQSAKSLFLVGWRANTFTSEMILSGEFISQGRNLVWILDYPPQFSGSEVLQTELQRGISFARLGGSTTSLSRWFNRDYRIELDIGGTSGWGFSLIASAYMWAGVFGVVCYFSFTSFCMMWIHKRIGVSEAYATLYFCLLPVCIYVMRQDLSYFIGDLIKFSVLSLLIVYLLKKLLYRLSKSHMHSTKNPEKNLI